MFQKLIRYPWKPASEQRIARHDATVMRNWKDLKEGSLDIPQDIRKHLLKFSDRTIPSLKKESIKIDLTQEKKMGEFESIVKRCAAQVQARNNTSNETNHTHETANKIHYVNKDRKRVTLDELSTKIKNRMDIGKKVGMPDQILLDAVNTKTSGVPELNSDVELSIEGESNEVVEYKAENVNEKSVMDYPERIRIPRNAYKKGATYKVNDCFYDHDGQFLYRVLGMSNK